MSILGHNSGGGNVRRVNRNEPAGALTVAQLNRLRGFCATHMAEEEASAADRPVPLPTDDVLFRLMEQELSRRVSIADYDRMRPSLPSTRYSFAKQFQRMLTVNANELDGIPLDWDDLRTRGEAGCARYAAKLDERARTEALELYERDAPARAMLVKSFGHIWDRLCQLAFNTAEKTPAAPILAGELDAMFRTDSATYYSLTHTALAPYFPDEVSSTQKEKCLFVSQCMCNFLHRVLNDKADERPFPESWQELDARLKGNEEEMLNFLEKQGSEVGLNLIGHEKELLKLYQDIGVRMKAIGRYSATSPHAGRGAYLN